VSGEIWGAFWSPSMKASHVDTMSSFAEEDVKSIMSGEKNNPWFLVFAGPESEAREVVAAYQDKCSRGEL